MYRVGLVVCLAFALFGSAVAQEQEQNEEYVGAESSAWRFGDPDERRTARYRELQDELSRPGQSQDHEELATPPGQRRRQEGIVSVALLQAPKAAKKAYQRGLTELKKKRPNLDKAASDLNIAVRECPELAPAWELLGWIATWRGNRPEAWAMFLCSVEADSRYQNGFIALARAASEDGRWEEATQWSAKAVAIDASASRAHFYWAVASYYSNDLDTAAREAQSALETPDPFLPAHCHQILGAVYHQRGDFNAAAEQYRLFLKAEPKHPLSAQLAKTLADWEAAGMVPTVSRTRPRS